MYNQSSCDYRKELQLLGYMYEGYTMSITSKTFANESLGHTSMLETPNKYNGYNYD